MIGTELLKGQGLGNQLFCYIATRCLALEKGCDFSILNREILANNIHSNKGMYFMDLDCGLDLKRCGLEICGRAKQVILDKDSTLMHGLWNEDKNSVESLRKYTTKLLKKADASYEIEKLQDTLAILDGTSAKLIAGGA